MIVKGMKKEPDYGNTPMAAPSMNEKKPKEEVFYTLEYDESGDDGEGPDWFEGAMKGAQNNKKEAE